MSYYEKIGDYESIVAVFDKLPSIVPNDIANYAIKIFERAPADAFTRVELFAGRHLRVLARLRRWQEFFALAAYYEQELLKLPEDSDFRNQALGFVYYVWGLVRFWVNTMEDRYDFGPYFIEMDDCLTKSPLKPGQITSFPVSPWINPVGSSVQGAPLEYANALTAMEKYVSKCLHGMMAGAGDLARGEFLFYQGDAQAAEPLIVLGLERARKHKQFEYVHRAQFYIMRLAVLQGNRAKAEQALKIIKDQMAKKEYPLRYVTYDIAFGWYHYLLRLPAMVPAWLKEDFTPYCNALFIDNFGNQMKARYHYMTRKSPPLLAYIGDMKGRESTLYGRAEMLAIEACARYQMKEGDGAIAALREAYETTSPNNILIPFIELGKDMRSLTAAAMRDKDCGIPGDWLKTVNNKAYVYAQRQASVIADHKKEYDTEDEAVLSPREIEVLSDLYNGFTKSEIAVKQGLSINTVKMVAKKIYEKLDAHNMVDIIRIAAERNLV
jgi:LuxR family maltose regulon positive regulatory protein